MTFHSIFSDLMHNVKCFGRLPCWNFSAACWVELWPRYHKAWHRFPGSSRGGIYLCKEHMHGRAAINIMQYYSKQGLGKLWVMSSDRSVCSLLPLPVQLKYSSKIIQYFVINLLFSLHTVSQMYNNPSRIYNQSISCPLSNHQSE